MVKPGFKKLKLYVKIRYTILYTDGINQLSTVDEAGFNLTIHAIYCPNCLTQIGVIRYPAEETASLLDEDGLILKVEALADVFNDAICVINGALALDIGVFFVVKCECIVQLLMPSYGYCPVPPEQPNSMQQNCCTFNDRTVTPFPTQLFPSQKINLLDAGVKDNKGNDDKEEGL